MRTAGLEAFQLLEGGDIMAKGKQLLRSKDVAWILDCCPDDVIDLARSGKLKAAKVGRLWKYRLADVMAYKRGREKEREAA